MTDEWRDRMKEIKAKASFGYIPQFRAEQRMSGCGRFCCKSPFPLQTKIFLGC